MNETDANRLLEKYRAGNCTDEEKAQLFNWFHQLGADESLDLSDEELEEVQQKIRTTIQLQTKGTITLWRKIAAAAVLFIVFGAGLYVYNKQKSNSMLSDKQLAADIMAGGNKAILTLSNGKKISLDQAENGVLTEQTGIKITKLADGQLSYIIEESDAVNTGMNSIETPPGGQYQINLPDGTKVWLNAASSLKYPVCFKGKNRKVTLSGEGYFEVAKNKKMPFIVTTESRNGLEQEIEVLGTHFNITAYNNNADIKTTLLEGSVKVSRPSVNATVKQSKILLPGQQCTADQHEMSVQAADTESIIAWKNGLFVFNNEAIKDAMKLISRWYDVEVNYKGQFDDIKIGGTIPRGHTLKQTLRLLELTGNFKFQIQGRRITVMN